MNKKSNTTKDTLVQDEDEDNLERILDHGILENFGQEHRWMWTEEDEKQFFSSGTFKDLSFVEIMLLKMKLKWMKDDLID